MTQTITNVSAGISTAPAEIGVPRLLSAYDFAADAADVLAIDGNLVSLRVDLAPLMDENSVDTDPNARISAGVAGNPYRAVLRSWPQISRKSASGEVVGGAVGTTVGSLAVVNERIESPNLNDEDDFEGRIDAWVTTRVWDQRLATMTAVAVTEGDPDEEPSVPVPILVARTSKVSNVRHDGFDIEISDLVQQLTKRVQTVRLLGTGGMEGGPELLGVRPPIVMGSPLNTTGLLVTTQPNPTYLVHRDPQGHPIQGVSAVYVGGNVVSPSNYVVTVGESNTVEITTALDDTKQVTFDVVGPTECGTTVSDFMRWLLVDIGPLDVTEIDAEALAVFRAQAPFSCGWAVGPDDSFVTVLDHLTKPWAWWGPNASGLIVAGLLIDPDQDFTDYVLPVDAIENVLPLPQVYPSTSIVTGYAKNWTMVTEDGVADAARDTERGKWSQQPHYRVADASDEAITSLYPSEDPPQDYVIPLLLTSEAQIVHNRISSLFGSKWQPYHILADIRAARFEANRVMTFSWPRWGCDDGLTYRIQSVGIVPSDNDIKVEIVAWRLPDVYVLGGDTDEEYLLNSPGSPMRLR